MIKIGKLTSFASHSHADNDGVSAPKKAPGNRSLKEQINWREQNSRVQVSHISTTAHMSSDANAQYSCDTQPHIKLGKSHSHMSIHVVTDSIYTVLP